MTIVVSASASCVAAERAVAYAFAEAHAAARRAAAAENSANERDLETRLAAFEQRMPANAHRLGSLEETGNGRTSVIRDVNVILSSGRPWAYVYRMRDGAFLVQRDLTSAGSLAVLDRPERQLARDAIVEPMRDRAGHRIPASHLFLPRQPFAPEAERCASEDHA